MSSTLSHVRAGMEAMLIVLEEALHDSAVSVQSAAAWALANAADSISQGPGPQPELYSRIAAGS